MASQKLVRCEIRRAGESSRGTVRYVPLEIYGLWEFLMQERHQFEVVVNVASLEKDGMFGRVNRYFPTQEYPELKKLLLQHYESVREPGAPNLQLKERQGIWIKREARVR
jgi:hypothetical protein